jgi:NAD(P)H-hydrate epimerase
MDKIRLHLNGPEYFRAVLAKRVPDSNKGNYGHVLVVGGAQGKTGAAEMTGLAALRAGAGLVTVASSAERLPIVELMTAPLPDSGPSLGAIAHRMNVIAIGPGLGTSAAATAVVREAVHFSAHAMVLDADAINVLAGHEWTSPEGMLRVLTPHPGEMARLCGSSVAEVQANRLSVATDYAVAHRCTVVLKGHRTVIALPDGRAWVNPTGSPALAKGGTGDILTGIVAGLLAQFPDRAEAAVLAAVYLHGRAGELGASELGEQSLLATDLLRYLPEAMRECQGLQDHV